MKVVFDTNVVASASFWRGAPFDCLAAWAQGRCVVVVSSNLLAEYHETIEELRLDYPGRKCVEWVEALTESAELVFPVERASGATPDPDDEMIFGVRAGSRSGLHRERRQETSARAPAISRHPDCKPGGISTAAVTSQLP